MKTGLVIAGIIGAGIMVTAAGVAAQGRGPGLRPRPSPLMAVLDADHDGVISAAEIANAPAALKSLDANHDGQLTPDEFRPAFGRGRGRGDAH